jgi:hypothetical protein
MNLGIYNATKAGLIQASEVWRLEMAPRRARHDSSHGWHLETKFLANLPSLTLPENSYYTCIKDLIENQPEHIPFAISPEAFRMTLYVR